MAEDAPNGRYLSVIILLLLIRSYHLIFRRHYRGRVVMHQGGGMRRHVKNLVHCARLVAKLLQCCK